jgi:anti-sigma B factor antagonist
VEFQVETVVLGDGVASVGVVGEADLYTAPELKDALNGLVEQEAYFILVDLTRTSFLDSTTLGVLMGAVRKVRARGGQIVLACADPNIRKIFEITMLDRVFEIFETSDEGVARLRKAAAEA